nr:protein phosphatase 2c like 2 [Quercus suber]
MRSIFQLPRLTATHRHALHLQSSVRRIRVYVPDALSLLRRTLMSLWLLLADHISHAIFNRPECRTRSWWLSSKDDLTAECHVGQEHEDAYDDDAEQARNIGVNGRSDLAFRPSTVKPASRLILQAPPSVNFLSGGRRDAYADGPSQSTLISTHIQDGCHRRRWIIDGRQTEANLGECIADAARGSLFARGSTDVPVDTAVPQKSDEGQDERVFFGVSCMQGWRISMEDAHATVLDLQALEGDEELKPAAADVRISYFGVYDGHGGDKVALYTGEHLHKIVAKQEAFKNKDFEQALKDGFLAIDRAILSDPRYEEEVSGCTASVGIITNDKIYVGNAGDSRSVLGIKGRAKPLSFDHKPQNEGEKARICAAGGFVDFGRVNGNLALSRAIGDFEFKKSADLPPEQQIVTAFPEVTVHDLGDDDEFLVIACDGIWDCQSSQAVVEFVRRGIAAKQELQAICENMMDNCLASNSETGGVGCDNMTMVVIGLLNGKTKEEWYKMIGDRVANGDGPCAPPEYGKSEP